MTDQVDLALGHVAALRKLTTKVGCDAYNLGSGKGYSVLDVIKVCVCVNGYARGTW